MSLIPSRHPGYRRKLTRVPRQQGLLRHPQRLMLFLGRSWTRVIALYTGTTTAAIAILAPMDLPIQTEQNIGLPLMLIGMGTMYGIIGAYADTGEVPTELRGRLQVARRNAAALGQAYPVRVAALWEQAFQLELARADLRARVRTMIRSTREAFIEAGEDSEYRQDTLTWTEVLDIADLTTADELANPAAAAAYVAAHAAYRAEQAEIDERSALLSEQLAVIETDMSADLALDGRTRANVHQALRARKSLPPLTVAREDLAAELELSRFRSQVVSDLTSPA